MQTAAQIQPKPMRMVAVVFASAGVALLVASGLSLVACFSGLLFGGISAFFVILVAVGLCAVVTPVTALFFRRRQRGFGWRTLFIEVSMLGLIAVSIMSWLDTRQHLRIFMAPSSVPSGLRVHHGRSILFSSYVHFTGPPAAIASLLQTKGLVEISAETPAGPNVSDFFTREQAKISWGWWQPVSMASPRFYFLHHQSDAIQGWNEGWWVSGATNEVYAFISG